MLGSEVSKNQHEMDKGGQLNSLKLLKMDVRVAFN